MLHCHFPTLLYYNTHDVRKNVLLLLLLALQPTMGFSLLSDSPPFRPFLTHLSPPSYSYRLDVFFSIFNPSFPWSPLILLPFGFHSNTLLGILFSSIHITFPNQAILLFFYESYYVCISYELIQILQDPSLSCTGPKIFLNILCMGEWLIFLIWKVLGSNHGSKTSCSV